MVRFLVLVVVAIVIPTGWASALTGTELYRFCAQSKKDDGADMFCKAYVRGFVDALGLGHYSAEHGIKYCPPDDGLSEVQARLIIEKFLREHPERMHEKAGIVAGLALFVAFDCKNQK
jgi:hypothetical protein